MSMVKVTGFLADLDTYTNGGRGVGVVATAIVVIMTVAKKAHQ